MLVCMSEVRLRKAGSGNSQICQMLLLQQTRCKFAHYIFGKCEFKLFSVMSRNTKRSAKSVKTDLLNDLNKNQPEVQTTNIDIAKFKAKPKKVLKSSSPKSKIKPVKDLSEDNLGESTEKCNKRPHLKVEHEEASLKSTMGAEKKSKHLPNNFEVILNNLREMRSKFDAPVDSMGCHKCYDETASPKVIKNTLRHIIL